MRRTARERAEAPGMRRPGAGYIRSKDSASSSNAPITGIISHLLTSVFKMQMNSLSSHPKSILSPYLPEEDAAVAAEV